MQTEHHDEVTKHRVTDNKVFEVGPILKFMRILLIALSYSSLLTIVVISIIYAKQMSTIHQYCFIASFFIGLFGNLMIS